MYPRCGDHYILVQLDFATEEDRIAFETVAKGNYAGAGGEVEVGFAKNAFNGRLNVSVFAYQQGGAV